MARTSRHGPAGFRDEASVWQFHVDKQTQRVPLGALAPEHLTDLSLLPSN